MNLFRACVLTLLPLLLAAEEGKANFSGRWRMDSARSDFGKFAKPDIVVRTIDQHDPSMNVHTVQTKGKQTSAVDLTYMTDGSVTSNVINGRDAQCRSYWDGSDLVVRTDMKTAKGQDEQIEDRYQLSNDGKTLTTTSHVITDTGEVTMTMVSTKEDIP